MTTIIQRIQSPVVISDAKSVIDEHDNHTTNHDDATQTIFFRVVNGKTMTLTVNPNIEIAAMKKMLLLKIALFNAIEAKSTSKSSSLHATSVLTQILGLFWLSSLCTPKLQAQDLCFIYRGKPLEDDMSFQTYYNNRVATSSSSVPPTIHVSVRLYGGCFMVSATVLGMIMTAIVGSTCTCGLSLIAVPFLLPLLFILPFFCL